MIQLYVGGSGWRRPATGPGASGGIDHDRIMCIDHVTAELANLQSPHKCNLEFSTRVADGTERRSEPPSTSGAGGGARGGLSGVPRAVPNRLLPVRFVSRLKMHLTHTHHGCASHVHARACRKTSAPTLTLAQLTHSALDPDCSTAFGEAS